MPYAVGQNAKEYAQKIPHADFSHVLKKQKADMIQRKCYYCARMFKMLNPAH